MLNTITEERVRQGEWNEALCFISDNHPRIEIAAQKGKNQDKNGNVTECWNIFYVSSRTAYGIRLNLNQAQAEETARLMAHDILNSSNPYRTAKGYK